MGQVPNMVTNHMASLPRPDPRQLSGKPLLSRYHLPRARSDFTLDPFVLPLGTQMGTALHLWMTPVALELFSTQGCPL